MTSDRKRRLGLARRASWYALLALLTSVPAAAQDAGGPSARDRQGAAEAYDRGTSAYLARDYARAAQWFETAHRLAPAAAALVEAARSYERAENTLAAASIGIQLQALYPEDRAASRMAERVLRGANRFVRVDVGCNADCTLQVDGTLVGHTSFFVEPGADHTVEASFEHGTQRETVRGAAGEQRSVSFTAPAAPAVEPDPDPDPDPDPIVTPPPSNGLAIIPWPVTLVGMGLTAVSGALLIWSGVDALDGVPAYEMNPTTEGLADGQMRELRTNVLIGVTSGIAAITLVMAILTDWGGGSPPVEAAASIEPTVSIQPDGGYAGLRGRF